MSIIKRMRKQVAVYWSLIEQLDSSGQPEWHIPVEVPVRWEEGSAQGNLTSVKLEDGSILTFRATVYVDRDMVHGDYLQLARLSSSTPDDPRDTTSWEVHRFEKIPNLRAKEFLRTTHLAPSHLRLAELQPNGLESITYKRVTGSAVSAGGIMTPTVTSIDIGVSIHDRLNDRELEKIGKYGDYTTITAAWEIPKKLLPEEPRSVDHFLDQGGVRWNVLGWEEGTLRDSWWRVIARRGA